MINAIATYWPLVVAVAGLVLWVWMKRKGWV